jgi:PAS domain S-box-containing protein
MHVHVALGSGAVNYGTCSDDGKRPMTILFCAPGDGIGAEAMKALLAGDPALLTASDASEALRVMEVERPTVVVVGGASSESVAASCRRLRSAEASRDVVIVAAIERAEEAQALLDAGADDFFVHSPRSDLLESRLLVAERAAAGIASRRSVEHELSEGLATTLDSIGDGVIATDGTGTILRMNPVAAKLTGWTFAEAKGRRPAEVLILVNSDTRAMVENPMDRTLREGVAVALAKHTLLVRPDGTEIPIADSCAPIKARDGTVSGIVLVFRDLTAQRDAEAVQAKVQKQLVFADRMAAVGTLAAGAAHEINNPLTYIAANLDTAIEEVRGMRGEASLRQMKELEEMLMEAHEGVSRIAKIVRGLKTFSRIDEERSRVIDVVPAIELAINVTSNEIRHRARLVKEYGELPFVEADSARLAQVVINLLINASHAFSEGDMLANEIRIVTWTDAGGRAVVEIHDTGPGIPAALLSRVFDPFFTTKPLGVGTGLGLAISHNIVAAMGGEISVRSEAGRGTIARVTLPPSRSVELSVSERAASKPISVRPAAVLVVDDEPAVGAAIRRVLRGHYVTVVTTGQDALDLLAAGKHFDVMLSDLMMPGMSGMSLYQTLAKRHPEIASRVVFLTGGAFTPEAKAFLDRVENERMEKPFDSTEMRELIQRFVPAEPVDQPPRTPSGKHVRIVPSFADNRLDRVAELVNEPVHARTAFSR